MAATTKNSLKISDPDLESFYKNNPDFDILNFEFHNKDKLSQFTTQLKDSGIGEDKIAGKVEYSIANQRLLKLHPDADLAKGLFDRGIVSANQLARIPRHVFIDVHAKQLKVDDNVAENIHKRATGIRNKSLHLWASIRGAVVSPFFSNSPMDTASSQLTQTFQNLPSYEEMFGTLNYCSCQECSSIFGPAAYLVDLLRIIDEYITKPNSKTIEADFLFSARRQDIGKIGLTCANTNTIIPYLEIVNERLLASAQQTLGASSPDDVIEQTATTLIYPQAAPFNYPLDQIRVLLDKVGADFGSILSAWKASSNTVASRSIGLSQDQQKIVTTTLITAASIAPFYNVTDITTLKEANTFIAKTWMTFPELLTLINQDLSESEQKAGLQVNFFLNQGLSGKWIALKQEKGQPSSLDNLDVTPLDQINRLQRLAAVTGQPAQVVDWVMRCIQGGATPVITDESLTSLQQLIELSKKFSMDLETSTALLGPIKTYGQGVNGAGSAFDQLFNSAAIISKNPPYRPSGNLLNPGYTDTPLSWTPGSTKSADISAINRVLPGLGIGISDVNALGVFLYGANTQQLTVQVITVLYRHVLLSRALQLPMDRYLVFLKLLKLEDPQAPAVTEILELASKGRWMNQLGLSIYQLDYILNGNPSVYVNPLYLPDNVDEWLRGLWSIVSASSPTVDKDIRAQIAVLFGAENALIKSLMTIAVAAEQLPTGVSSWENAFMTANGTTPKYGDYVQAVLKTVSRGLILTQTLTFSDAIVANVAAYPVAYQLTSKFNTISWDAIQCIQQVQQMMQNLGDLQQNLLVYIGLASSEDTPSESTLLVLQKATGWEPSVAAKLLAGPLKGETVITSQLAALQKCFKLMNNLGANPEFMASITALGDLPALNNWTAYTQTAADVMAKTASIYGIQWGTIWNELSGNIAKNIRNVLLSLVLAQLNGKYPSIKSDRNVYEFLLTDVEMGPTTTISYIKEALNASQLYLQRCRLRLEPGVTDLTQIQEPWWEWMMNYRVWQANREIFVYPENYLIPTLRKNTTQQFTALSQALQQSDVTTAYVGSAFNAYINGFDEVAQLKPVDAYRTNIGDTHTLFLLSRTKTGPYTYYYCSQVENMPWTPWEKIDLTINSQNCTLIYAFNRPFLFWNEIKKNDTSAVSGEKGAIKTDNSFTYTVSVMYSFLNQEGKWVQPQTLVDQETVLFQSDDSSKTNLKDKNIFDSIFNMDSVSWNKVFAFYVTARNYVTQPKFKAEAERLVVMYGPNLLNTGTTVKVKDISPTTDPKVKEFLSKLDRRVEDHNRMVMGQLSGNVNLRPVSVLNLSLEGDVLIQRKELLLADPYDPMTPLSLICPEMQSSGDAMQIAHSGRPITDNRNAIGNVGLTSGSEATSVNGNSFIGAGISPVQSRSIFDALKTDNIVDGSGNVQPASMAKLDLYTTLSGMTVYNEFGPAQYSAVLQVLFNHMDATELFSSVGGSQTNVVPVGTQPGWFLFFASNEIFLLSPKPSTEGESVFSTFAEGLTVGDPLIEPTFAIMKYQGTSPGSIDMSTSMEIYTALKGIKLIVDGRLSPLATFDLVKMGLSNLILQKHITEDQVVYIYNALTNAPMIFDDAFSNDDIDNDKSKTIYTTLQNSLAIIDSNGRITKANFTGKFLEMSLGNLLLNQTITQSQISIIYQILAQAPKAIALTYINKGNTTGLTKTSDFHFDVTRLSTDAISKISRALFIGGVDSLLDLKTQAIPVVPVLPIDRFAPSTTNLILPGALDATQVDFDGLYGQYFWEIFYHIPMLVSHSLNTNQQFQDAQTWLQYVFDPTVKEQFATADVIVNETAQEISQQQADGIITQLQSNDIGSTPAPILSAEGEVNPDFTSTTDLSFLKTADPTLKNDQVSMVRNILLNYQLNAPSGHYWQFRPFRNHTLQSLEKMLSDSNPAVKVYNDDPFDPFAIARLRIGAFEKSTFMQYIDNLINWGDQLFTQDSWESITAAYMLYVYAYDLLGPKPELVGESSRDGVTLTFNEIKEKYPDGIPQFLIDLEYFIPGGTGTDTPMMGHAFNDLYVYFCVPENRDLMSRWDIVQDRMHKINNSMNIKGVVRELLLFQPPINPLDLVKAASAGNNVQQITTSTHQPSPYRYSSNIGVANSLCATLIELGNSLLSVLEKNDAEGLSILRSTQEAQILDMVTQIKQDRISELQATIKSLNTSQGGAKDRVTYYTNLINKGLNDYEKTSLSATEAALAFNILGSISKTAATIAYAVPQVGSPFAMTYGGIQVGSAVNAASGVFEIGSEISSYIAQRASTMGGYARRSEEWGLQNQLAQVDVESLTHQIEAANLQLQSAQQDLAVHKKSIAQNNAIETYLKDKFTNQDLYQWMIGRLSAVYFQTYSLALQVARQAEASYQFELDSSQTFLAFDYWDSLHKGLTAGEGLRLALNRMDTAYRTDDTRRLEVEKTISLAMIAPDQLLALKTTGECGFSFSEALFDYDYPGQYARKIKTISVSIPAVVGPYQDIKAILTQTKNSVVTSSDIKAVKYLLNPDGDPPAQGLRQNWAQNQSIAISRGIDESGMFVLDFQDPRYLPFENTGAVSDWTLTMPLETNRFDFEQLSDVIITARYTSLFDGKLEKDVKQALKQAPLGGGVYVDGSMQSNAWQTFLVDHSDKTKQTLTLNINPAQLGFFKSLTYTEIILQLDVAKGITIADGATFLSLTAETEPVQKPPFTKGQAEVDKLSWDGKTLLPSWKFEFALTDPKLKPLLTDGFIDGKKLLNLQVIVLYQAKVF